VVFWVVLGFLAITHAMHDIACDGFYMLALDGRGQALYSGTRQAAYRAAMYVGGALLVYLASPTRDLGMFGEAGTSHWPFVLGLAASLMVSVGLLNAWLMPHVDESGILKQEGGKQPFWAPYRTFFQQPHVALVLAFALTYRLGDTMTSTMSSVLLRDQGFTLDDRALLRSISLTVTIGGSVLAGYLLARGGLERWFRPFTWVMAIPWYLVVAIVHPPLWGVAICVVLEQLCGALAGTAATVFLMRRCRRAFSASHYAFFTALVSLGSTLSGAFSGKLYELVHPVPYFALTLVASIPALMLVRQMETTSLHRPAAVAGFPPGKVS
jgi:PAT family beta-lactamase induction signal transducer AmpG